jgi:8-amino-7-oxononanoate synthase
VKPRFLQLLENRKESGSYRSLSLFKDFIDFYSNDYLGLSRHSSPESFREVTRLPKAFGRSLGSTGSRLISGNSAEAVTCENFLASFFHAEAALVFNSGYDANIGFFSSVPQKGDTIIYDSLIHASIRDGIRLSHAKSYSFAHNDLQDLKKKLMLSEGSIFVAVESLYSMDGDLCPIEDILEVCKCFGANLIVDEAHAAGVFGEEGKGLSYQKEVFARIVTFGKAYGFHGAAVLGSQDLKNFLVNFARSFIYTTALPMHDYVLIQKQIEYSLDNRLRIQLQSNIDFFRSKLNYQGVSATNSPIQIIEVPGVESALSLAKRLQENNFAVKAILSPTVPEGQERIRICLHAFNTKLEINNLIEILHHFKNDNLILNI